ncbi:MAG: hypothetical protein V1767_08730 [Chloroflexota bacterium]
MNCNRCNRELTENESYVYQSKVFCESCLMDVGLSIKECDPWATYIDTSARKRHGETGAAGLSETQAKIYDFVKSQGRVSRGDVMKNLSLSEIDLKAELIPLMHSDLVKEIGKGSEMYLIPTNKP